MISFLPNVATCFRSPKKAENTNCVARLIEALRSFPKAKVLDEGIFKTLIDVVVDMNSLITDNVLVYLVLDLLR